MSRRIGVTISWFPRVALIGCAIGLMVGRAVAQEQLELNTLLPPHEARYVGLTKCAACHFDQYKDWKGSEHHRAYEILPAKYRNDASCLKCHTTGKEGDALSQQFGVSCEACHGPGEEHAKHALRVVNENRLLSEEELTSLRQKIKRLDLHQCVTCHISKAHKKHPPFDRDEVAPKPVRRSVSFFGNVHDADTRSQSTVDSPRQFNRPAVPLNRQR